MTDSLTLRSAPLASPTPSANIERTASPSLMERLGNIANTVVNHFLTPVLDCGTRVLQGLTLLLADKLPALEAKPHMESLAATRNSRASQDLPDDTLAYLARSGIPIKTPGGDMTINGYLQSIERTDGRNLDQAQLETIRASLAHAAERDLGGKILSGTASVLQVASSIRDVLKLLLEVKNNLQPSAA